MSKRDDFKLPKVTLEDAEKAMALLDKGIALEKRRGQNLDLRNTTALDRYLRGGNSIH